jgi:tRNA A-37 threonylcarbamoyl transferase component Bud32
MKSKRNNIQLINQRIVKTFIKGDCQLEVQIYELLKSANINHASVIDVKHNQLILEHIQGPTLLELLVTCEQNQESFVPYLNRWLTYMEQFYKATKNYRHGDVNLSNFILVGEDVVGLDFEQALIQDPIKDMADVMCYVLFYEPILTDFKRNTVALWFQNHPWRLQLNHKIWIDELSDAMYRLNHRRNTDYVVDWSFILKPQHNTK